MRLRRSDGIQKRGTNLTGLAGEETVGVGVRGAGLVEALVCP